MADKFDIDCTIFLKNYKK